MKHAGVGFLPLLGLLFIGLKLAGCIDWSWLLVLLPLYGPFVFFGLLIFVALAFTCGLAVIEALVRFCRGR
jgi:hypothetical protein